MEIQKTLDTFQQKIDEARSLLTRETRNAIDSVDWNLIIEGMSNKYSPDQIETLKIETELLLCGILNPKSYQEEVEKRMMIPRTEAERLLDDMDKLIFKKIQDKLIDSLTYKKESNQNISNEKPKNLDERFSSLPSNLKEAIRQSNWQVKIYEIGKKYQLSVDQMGILEEIISKTLVGDIHIDKLDVELKTKINLPNDKINELIGDINNEIFKDIRGLLKVVSNKEQVVGEEEAPLPPYNEVESSEQQVAGEVKEEAPIPPDKAITNDQLLITNEETIKEDNKILKDSGIEIEEEVSNKEQVVSKEKNNKILEDSGIDIIGEKLMKPTVNNTSTSDYSLPKMTPESKDPYREEIQ